MTTTSNLAGKRIGLFGKGGSGKSTVAVLLARALRRAGYAVCVIDADSTNIGLAQALGIAAPPQPLLDYFGGLVFSGGAVTCPVDDPTPLPGADLDLADLPGQYVARSPEGILFCIAGKMGDKGPGAGCDGPIAKIARDFRAQVAGRQPVTLVDFKAGFEDSARGSLISLDWVIVIVDPTAAAMRMAVDMQEMVAQLRAGQRPSTAHLPEPRLVEMVYQMYRAAAVQGVLYILNRVRDTETEQFMLAALAAQGIVPLGVIHDAPEVAAAWLRGAPLPGAAEGEAAALLAALEAAQAGQAALHPA